MDVKEKLIKIYDSVVAKEGRATVSNSLTAKKPAGVYVSYYVRTSIFWLFLKYHYQLFKNQARNNLKSEKVLKLELIGAYKLKAHLVN